MTRAFATTSTQSAVCTQHSPHQRQPLKTLPTGYGDGYFNGQWQERVAQLYLLGHGVRAYLPSLMRFNSADISSPFGSGGSNAYAYCQADPVNFHDPNGHMPLRSAIKVIKQQMASTDGLTMDSALVKKISDLRNMHKQAAKNNGNYSKTLRDYQVADSLKTAASKNPHLQSALAQHGIDPSVWPKFEILDVFNVSKGQNPGYELPAQYHEMMALWKKQRLLHKPATPARQPSASD